MTTVVESPIDHLPAGWLPVDHDTFVADAGLVVLFDGPREWASLAKWRITIRADGRKWIERIYNNQHLYIVPNTSPTTSSEWPWEWGSIVDSWRFARSGVAPDLTTAMVEAQSWTSVLD